MIRNSQIEWVNTDPLGNAENKLIQMGSINAAIGAAGLPTAVKVSEFGKLSWAINDSHASTFSIEISFQQSFAAFDTLLSIGVLAGVECTPYNLPAPMNGLGYVVVSAPFVRLRMVDAAAAVHTHLRFYAKVWE